MTQQLSQGGIVIERGSNGNGKFEKTYAADGTLIKQVATHSRTGGGTWTYPAAFPSAPRVAMAAEANSVTARSACYEATTATTVKLWVFNTASGVQVAGSAHIVATWLLGS